MDTTTFSVRQLLSLTPRIIAGDKFVRTGFNHYLASDHPKECKLHYANATYGPDVTWTAYCRNWRDLCKCKACMVMVEQAVDCLGVIPTYRGYDNTEREYPGDWRVQTEQIDNPDGTKRCDPVEKKLYSMKQVDQLFTACMTNVYNGMVDAERNKLGRLLSGF